MAAARASDHDGAAGGQQEPGGRGEGQAGGRDSEQATGGKRKYIKGIISQDFNVGSENNVSKIVFKKKLKIIIET